MLPDGFVWINNTMRAVSDNGHGVYVVYLDLEDAKALNKQHRQRNRRR